MKVSKSASKLDIVNNNEAVELSDPLGLEAKYYNSYSGQYLDFYRLHND